MKRYQSDRGILQATGKSGSKTGMTVIVPEGRGMDPEGVMAPQGEVR